MSNEAAIWEFERLPSNLASRGHVQVRLNYHLFSTARFFDGVADAKFTFVNRMKWNPLRLGEYRKAMEGKLGNRMKPEALAREFGIFELEAVRLSADKNLDSKRFSGSLITDLKNALLGERLPAPNQSPPLSFPGSLVTDLKDGILEIRVECRTKYVFLGFKADDMLIMTTSAR
jgi:hypothetical protein